MHHTESPNCCTVCTWVEVERSGSSSPSSSRGLPGVARHFTWYLKPTPDPTFSNSTKYPPLRDWSTVGGTERELASTSSVQGLSFWLWQHWISSFLFVPPFHLCPRTFPFSFFPWQCMKQRRKTTPSNANLNCSSPTVNHGRHSDRNVSSSC